MMPHKPWALNLSPDFMWPRRVFCLTTLWLGSFGAERRINRQSRIERQGESQEEPQVYCPHVLATSHCVYIHIYICLYIHMCCSVNIWSNVPFLWANFWSNFSFVAGRLIFCKKEAKHCVINWPNSARISGPIVLQHNWIRCWRNLRPATGAASWTSFGQFLFVGRRNR